MGSGPLDETDGAGSLATTAFKEYVFFNGKRIARRDSTNAVNYYFADHLGTARIAAKGVEVGVVKNDARRAGDDTGSAKAICFQKLASRLATSGFCRTCPSSDVTGT
jgi:hypothetical protein